MTLKEFFEKYNKVAIAFSGGVDSAYLLKVASKLKIEAKAYYVKSQFQPDFELEDARAIAKETGIAMEVIYLDSLKNENIRCNPENRCYHCKKAIFGEIYKKAKEDGFSVILDGTNASDKFEERPGMKALVELEVLSPLRICGLSKGDVRKLSREEGLFTWDKPSYSCLATRIPCGMEITEENLKKVEEAEKYLMSLGIKQVRARVGEGGKLCKLEIGEDDFKIIFENRKEIKNRLIAMFDDVLLNLIEREGQ